MRLMRCSNAVEWMLGSSTPLDSQADPTAEPVNGLGTRERSGSELNGGIKSITSVVNQFLLLFFGQSPSMIMTGQKHLLPVRQRKRRTVEVLLTDVGKRGPQLLYRDWRS